MAYVPTAESQTPWSNQIESLKLEYKNTVDRHPDAGDVMERVYVHLKDIVSLDGCTPASAGENSKLKQIVTNAADTRRKLYQILQGKRLYSALHTISADV
jgi:hypothetical protein